MYGAVGVFGFCVALLLERSDAFPVPLFTDRPILCSFFSSGPCTGPRAVLTLACLPPRGWSRVCVEVSFDRWRSRVRRSSPCTGPKAEFAISCLSSRGRYWMCLRGDCGVCVWSGVLGSPLQVTCQCRPFSSVVSCFSGCGVAGVVSSDGIGGLGTSQMRLVAFPVSPLLRSSCGESQMWSFSQPRRRQRVVICARCCVVVLFSDALVAKAGASPASSLWVAILPSLCSSQGACARNSASSPRFFAVSGHDVLQWLLISSKAFCGCSSCFFVVRLVATMWTCCARLWLGIICGACCESSDCLSVSRWSRLACFQCWPRNCIDTG